MRLRAAVAFLLFTGALVVGAGSSTAWADVGDCFITGGGVWSGGDSFSVSAKSVNGVSSGIFRVSTPAGEFHGTVTAANCRRNGGGGPGVPAGDANIGDIEGTGSWPGSDSYEFAATFHDHGEGNCDGRLPDDGAVAVASGGPILYSAGGQLSTCQGLYPIGGRGGNIQIHQPHP